MATDKKPRHLVASECNRILDLTGSLNSSGERNDLESVPHTYGSIQNDSNSNNDIEELFPQYPIEIQRMAKAQEQLINQDKITHEKTKWRQYSVISVIKKAFPIVEWLPNYNWNTWLVDDFIAGLTVAIMHVPQGLAYGTLAGVHAVNGLYVSIFPVFIYCFLGTSRHISIGTFAIVSLLVAAAIHNVREDPDFTTLSNNGTLTNIEICASLAIMAGFFQRVYDVLSHLNQTNLITLCISMCVLIAGFSFSFINTAYKDSMRVPIPIDLIMLSLVTIVSYTADLPGRFNVTVVGAVPTGLPQPIIPRWDVIPYIWVQSFVIALVVFTIGLSMGRFFAKKHGYKIRANQELLALGVANIVSSFLRCYPCAVSLSRSSVQEKSGGKTQFASIISCAVLLLVMLFAGPVFTYLPKCVLSSVIIVALWSLLRNIRHVQLHWKADKFDALVWILTFLTTVCISLDKGVLGGILFSILVVIYKSVTPNIVVLGQLPNSEIYVDVNRSSEVEEVPGVKIIRFNSSMYFANVEICRKSVIKKTGLNKCHSLQDTEEIIPPNGDSSLRVVVLDMAACAYLDYTALEGLQELIMELKQHEITLYFAACTGRVFDVLRDYKLHRTDNNMPRIFPTVHDAVVYAISDA